MESGLNTGDPTKGALNKAALEDGLNYRISARPLIHDGGSEKDGIRDLPRSYGTETLCLMARDPHSLFAYWDIDWKAAFGDQPARARKVYLRVWNAAGAEQVSQEVEPMAGSCQVAVAEAGSAYSGEIGYFEPATLWNCLAVSEVVTTPPGTLAAIGEADFATVPFHFSFQSMIDALRVSKQENTSLTAMLRDLRDLRDRAVASESNGALTGEERELALVLELVAPAAKSRSKDPAIPWTRQKLERVMGLGSTSPEGGFGGSSRSA